MLTHVTLTFASELLSEVLKDLLNHKSFAEMTKKQQLIFDVSHSVNTKNGELVRRHSEFHHVHRDGNTKNSVLFDKTLNEQKRKEVQDWQKQDY